MTRYLHITAIALAGALTSGCSTLSAAEYADTIPAAQENLELCDITRDAPVTVVTIAGGAMARTTLTSDRQPISDDESDAAKLNREMTDAIRANPVCGPYAVRLTYKLDGTDDPAKRIVMMMQRPASGNVPKKRIRLAQLNAGNSF